MGRKTLSVVMDEHARCHMYVAAKAYVRGHPWGGEGMKTKRAQESLLEHLQAKNIYCVPSFFLHLLSAYEVLSDHRPNNLVSGRLTVACVAPIKFTSTFLILVGPQ